MAVGPSPSLDSVSLSAATAAPDTSPGVGRLEFTRVARRTALTQAFAASPLKVLTPGRPDRCASAYLATYGGGLVGGDRIDVSIRVGRGAAALVATQASTKVYRSPLGARQELRAHVAGDGLLVLLPDPVTCFSGARYRQEQHVRLDAGANLVLVDRLTAGRIESGERWRFDQYTSRLFVWQDDRLVLHDALVLTRKDDDIARRLGRFNCVGVVVLAGPALTAAADSIARRIDAQPVTRCPDFLASAAPLDGGGVMIRLASCSVEDLGLTLRRELGFLTTLLDRDPWVGK